MASPSLDSKSGAPLLKAYGDKLIVRPESEPGFETAELQRGVVVAVGGGYWSGGMQVKLKVSDGDTVLYTGGRPFDFAGERYVGLSYFDLYGGVTVEGMQHERSHD